MDEIETRARELLKPFAFTQGVLFGDGTTKVTDALVKVSDAVPVLVAALQQGRNGVLEEALENARAALSEIKQWCDAYPVAMFPEPDLVAVQKVLTDADMRGQIDRMHAGWARHITKGIGDIASAALKSSSDGAEG